MNAVHIALVAADCVFSVNQGMKEKTEDGLCGENAGRRERAC